MEERRTNPSFQCKSELNLDPTHTHLPRPAQSFVEAAAKPGLQLAVHYYWQGERLGELAWSGTVSEPAAAEAG